MKIKMLNGIYEIYENIAQLNVDDILRNYRNNKEFFWKLKRLTFPFLRTLEPNDYDMAKSMKKFFETFLKTCGNRKFFVNEILKLLDQLERKWKEMEQIFDPENFETKTGKNQECSAHVYFTNPANGFDMVYCENIGKKTYFVVFNGQNFGMTSLDEKQEYAKQLLQKLGESLPLPLYRAASGEKQAFPKSMSKKLKKTSHCVFQKPIFVGSNLVFHWMPLFKYKDQLHSIWKNLEAEMELSIITDTKCLMNLATIKTEPMFLPMRFRKEGGKFILEIVNEKLSSNYDKNWWEDEVVNSLTNITENMFKESQSFGRSNKDCSPTPTKEELVSDLKCYQYSSKLFETRNSKSITVHYTSPVNEFVRISETKNIYEPTHSIRSKDLNLDNGTMFFVECQLMGIKNIKVFHSNNTCEVISLKECMCPYSIKKVEEVFHQLNEHLDEIVDTFEDVGNDLYSFILTKAINTSKNKGEDGECYLQITVE